MCGIAGATRQDVESRVRLMLELMHDRGPDDEGHMYEPDGSVGIGARRLSIIDVAHGHQPVSSEDDRVWAVQNGEIYNHQPLRDKLLRSGHQLRSGADTEVLPHLFEEYGPDMVHALEGMFAFAVWDRQAGTLLLARDRVGEKPLFYTEAGPFAFASELGTLRAATSLDEVDPDAVAEFLTLGYVRWPRSMFLGVRQLGPGQLLTWSRSTGAVEVRTYWEPPVSSSTLAGPADTLEATALVRQAVRSRLMADVPVGVFLSGGIDSSLVALMAASAVPGRLRTFTVGYSGGGAVNELAAARVTADIIDAEHQELVMQDPDVVEASTVLTRMDQPVADQALVALHALSRHARSTVKVVVGGEGADEFFGGYPRYRWLDRAARLEGRVPQGLRELAAAGARRVPGRAARPLGLVLSPAGAWERNLSWLALGSRTEIEALAGPRITTGIAAAMAPPGQAGLSPSGMAVAYDQRHWLPDDVLAKADRASMRASLEMRTPFLDRRLLEFAAGFSLADHARGGGKRLLRAAFAADAPRRLPHRPKTAFRVPAGAWLRGPLRRRFEGHLETATLSSMGLVDQAALRGMWQAHLAGNPVNLRLLWASFTLAEWAAGQLTGT